MIDPQAEKFLQGSIEMDGALICGDWRDCTARIEAEFGVLIVWVHCVRLRMALYACEVIRLQEMSFSGEGTTD